MMQDKPLDPSERTLLKTMAELHAAHGSVSRDALSVATRGRGVEFGRSYAHIKTLGLIAEAERRPFVLRRLFGAQTVIMVLLTEAGRMALSEMAAPRAPHPPNRAPVPVWGPIDPPAPSLPKPDLSAKAWAPSPTPTPSPIAQSQPAKRRAVIGFTEDLGGAPLQPEAVSPGLDADFEAMDALRDVLSGLGMDLTLAGEMLVNHRMAQGANVAEALMQVILYTFAHAVRHDLSQSGQITALGLADYAAEVRREVQKLRDAGSISAVRFDADMGQLAVLIADPDTAAALTATLLKDPFGGAAPPALLPDDLRAGQSDDSDEEDRF